MASQVGNEADWQSGALCYVNETAIWEDLGPHKRGEGGRFADRWVKSRGESLAIGICLIIFKGHVVG